MSTLTIPCFPDLSVTAMYVCLEEAQLETLWRQLSFSISVPSVAEKMNVYSIPLVGF